MKAKIPVARILNALALALGTLAVAGCVAYGGAVPVLHPQPYPHPYSERHFQIPQGHMPPPGACRIWLPDLPPGQQPPPGDCRDLERRVPPGAVLIRG